MTTNDEVYDLLHAAAEGSWGREAAVELLHEHGRWLVPLERHGWITTSETDEEDAVEDGVEPYTYAFIQWQRVAEALDGGDEVGLASDRVMALRVGSGSERAVLSLACSIAAGTPTSMLDLVRLDRSNRKLALRAIAHGMAGRAYADQVFPPGRRV